MKKSIFLFFAAILCATNAWGDTTFKAGEILFYDFSAITGGANWTWNNGSGMAYDAQAHKTVKAILFTADETWTKGKTIAKTGTGNWSGITFKDREDGTNCIKIGADGKSYTWTTHSIEEDILSGKYIMVYGGELNSWSQSEYYFLLNNDANQEQKAAAVKAKLSITISSESYKMGPALLPAGTTSYYQGHWNSGLKCSVEAGSAYVVRNSTSKSNYTKKAQSGSDYLYQVKQNSTAPTTTLSPTCPTKILQGEKLSFSHGEAGVSVVGKTNTVKYYLQNGTTYTEKTLTDGTIDVSDLPAGNYSIITLLYDGYIYVKASISNFTIESAYDVTFANDGNGTTNQTGTIKVGSSTGIVIDATPSTDYEFKAWESSNGGSFATTAADASNTFYPTANTTLTATFRSTAVNALLVVAGENITSVTGSAEPVTLGSSYPISATFPAGYKFTTWTAEPAANATFADAASATTDVTVLNGSVTVTASAEEVLSTLTTANEYNEGTPTIAAPTASVAKIGVTTTATVAAATGTGYTFAGWKLDNCVRTDAGADNTTTITVKSNGDGVAAKVTAKYEQNVVYFVNTKGWSTVKVYAWNDGGASNAAWSGVALTDANIVKQIGGCDVYKYVPGADYAKVIFNNGSEQTDDLAWQNGKYYVYNSENTKDVSDWYTEAEVEGVLPDPVELTYTVEVPAGTHECYIAGGMNGWNFTKMTPVDATHFTTTIQWATNADKYKYTSGPDWAYVEVKADGGEVADRTYNANDKVAKWSAVYDPSATVYDYYVVGTMNEWTQNDENYGMSKVGETTTYAKELTLAAGTYKFKVKGTAWYGYTDIIGEYTEISAEKDGEGNPTGNIQLTLAAEKTFTVIFDPANNLITFEDLTVVEDYYTIVGATAITGANWDPANEANKMAKDGEAYTLTKTGLKLEAGDYEYKVAKNGAWGDGQYPAEGNQKVTITETAEYTIVYTYTVGTSLTAVATKTGEYTPAQTVYTVVGDAALCGTDWKADDAANDMTANGDGTYTWTKADVKLTSNVGFKVVKNHDFGNGEYPAENWNINLANYEGAAVYTVTITFTESSKEIAVTLTKTGEATPPVITYVLMGVNGNWDNGIALTQNPGNEDEYVLENQVIIKATDAVKVVTLTDGTATAWCGNVDAYSNATYTGGGNDNIVLEDGIYTFYFKKTANNIYINQTGYARNVTAGNLGTICLPFNVPAGKASGATFYTLAGMDANGRVAFDEVTTGELAAGKSYLFQANAAQIVCYYGTTSVSSPDDTGAMKGTFVNLTLTELSNVYYFAGGALWSCVDLTSLSVPANRAYVDMEEVDLITGAASVGVRRITLGVNGQNTATGMENVDASAQPVKTIINGQLYVLRGEKMYDAQGKLVK